MSVMTTKFQVNAWEADVAAAAAMMVVMPMVMTISVARSAAMRDAAPAVDRVATTAVSNDAALTINRISA